ncbi:MAG: ester cyclase [bacterium]|nr:ester cyclase [bacterium]
MESIGPEALVRTYCIAKSRGDVAAALRVCHPDFVLETIPFGTRSQGAGETALHLTAFFAAFPDYTVLLEGLAADGDAVVCWGDVRLTLRGPLGPLPPTDRTARLPMCSIFTVRDGLLAGERFHFDLHALCTQLGLSVHEVDAALAPFRTVPHAALEA